MQKRSDLTGKSLSRAAQVLMNLVKDLKNAMPGKMKSSAAATTTQLKHKKTSGGTNPVSAAWSSAASHAVRIAILLHTSSAVNKPGEGVCAEDLASILPSPLEELQYMILQAEDAGVVACACAAMAEAVKMLWRPGTDILIMSHLPLDTADTAYETMRYIVDQDDPSSIDTGELEAGQLPLEVMIGIVMPRLVMALVKIAAATERSTVSYVPETGRGATDSGRGSGGSGGSGGSEDDGADADDDRVDESADDYFDDDDQDRDGGIYVVLRAPDTVDGAGSGTSSPATVEKITDLRHCAHGGAFESLGSGEDGCGDPVNACLDDPEFQYQYFRDPMWFAALLTDFAILSKPCRVSLAGDQKFLIALSTLLESAWARSLSGRGGRRFSAMQRMVRQLLTVLLVQPDEGLTRLVLGSAHLMDWTLRFVTVEPTRTGTQLRRVCHAAKMLMYMLRVHVVAAELAIVRDSCRHLVRLLCERADTLYKLNLEWMKSAADAAAVLPTKFKFPPDYVTAPLRPAAALLCGVSSVIQSAQYKKEVASGLAEIALSWKSGFIIEIVNDLSVKDTVLAAYIIAGLCLCDNEALATAMRDRHEAMAMCLRFAFAAADVLTMPGSAPVNRQCKLLKEVVFSNQFLLIAAAGLCKNHTRNALAVAQNSRVLRALLAGLETLELAVLPLCPAREVLALLLAIANHAPDAVATAIVEAEAFRWLRRAAESVRVPEVAFLATELLLLVVKSTVGANAFGDGASHPEFLLDVSRGPANDVSLTTRYHAARVYADWVHGDDTSS